MARGSLVTLSPNEEVVLRQIQHGSSSVDRSVAAKLIKHMLVERAAGGLRLTPLGRLRCDALPKAPLLSRPRSVHLITGYVDGLLQKARQREYVLPAAVPVSAIGAVVGASEATGQEDEPPLLTPPPYMLFDSAQAVRRAKAALTRVRDAMIDHRLRQVRLCDDSMRCIDLSRLLLRQSLPVRRGGLPEPVQTGEAEGELDRRWRSSPPSRMSRTFASTAHTVASELAALRKLGVARRRGPERSTKTTAPLEP